MTASRECARPSTGLARRQRRRRCTLRQRDGDQPPTASQHTRSTRHRAHARHRSHPRRAPPRSDPQEPVLTDIAPGQQREEEQQRGSRQQDIRIEPGQRLHRRERDRQDGQAEHDVLVATRHAGRHRTRNPNTPAQFARQAHQLVACATDGPTAHGNGEGERGGGPARRRDHALQAGGERGAGGWRDEAFCACVQQRVGVESLWPPASAVPAMHPALRPGRRRDRLAALGRTPGLTGARSHRRVPGAVDGVAPPGRRAVEESRPPSSA